MPLTRPLRRRDFRLLWAGLAVSLLGDGFFMVAIAWQAYALANRPATLAYVGLALSLPQVAMLLVGGAVSDRVRRQSVLFWADVSRAAVVGVLAMLAFANTLHLWEVYVVAALLGTASAFAYPALDALVPQLVPVQELAEANAVDQLVRPITIQLAGPALGGLVVAVLRPAGAFAFDAMTFAFSAACVVRMARCEPPTAGDARGGYRHEVFEGLRYVRSHVWLWGTFVAASFAYLLFVGPTEVLLPYLVRNSLHQGAFTYGLVLAVGGSGALITAVVMSRAPEPRRPLTFIYLWWAVATLAVTGYGIATNALGLCVAAFVVYAGEAAGAIVWATLKQRRVPNAMLGRVSSIDWCVSTAFLPLSFALTVPVAGLLGARTTLVLAGTVGAAVTLGFLFLPGMRTGEESVVVPTAGVLSDRSL
jgi:MFS family permease